ncbi:peptidylprolyl isomerase [Cysteiniphilum sp. QT6929]|uniref:peptidylprolyl isomerase n=1 Tax=Cysteiniphilum sp. QT6929 TaxID=2975055 RepID=UPI0024B38475|nr:peptidylprolyl isomerase [Cysteiniphilum sp. QT6929]WHN64979.1 peptidylprolyl isomerase [Cysteiniphilum sp. QT6929]
MAFADTPPALLQKPSVTHAQNTTVKGKHLINEIVAIVNDQAITLDQLNIEVAKTKAQLDSNPNAQVPDDLTLQRQVLQQLINQTIALQMAKRQGISVTDDEVNNSITEVTAQNGITLAQLKQKLKASNLDYSTYYQTVKDQLIINKLQQRAVAGKVYISPTEVDKYIKKHFSDNQTEYLVNNIVLSLPDNPTTEDQQKVIAQAKEIIQSIKDKKITFADAAKKYSQAGNASSGGSLDWKTLNKLPSIYQNKVEALQNGQISAPFIANGSVQIIELADSKTPESAKHFVEQYHVQQIVINTSPVVTDNDAKAKLMRILTALDNHQSFSDLAKANSDALDNADSGGDMGWISLNAQPPALAQAIKAAKLKKVSAPFKVNNGWQIIEVLAKRKQDDTANYQKEQAMMALFNENAQQALKTWMLSLRDSAYVEIVDQNLNLPEA